MVPTEKLHESEADNRKRTVDSLEDESWVKYLIALLIISNLCQDLADNFENSDPEAKTDDANETCSDVSGVQITQLIFDGLFTFIVGVADIVVYSFSTVGKEGETNKNSELDNENDQVEEPGEGSYSRGFKAFFIFHLKFSLHVYCARAREETAAVTFKTVPAGKLLFIRFRWTELRIGKRKRHIQNNGNINITIIRIRLK